MRKLLLTSLLLSVAFIAAGALQPRLALARNDEMPGAASTDLTPTPPRQLHHPGNHPRARDHKKLEAAREAAPSPLSAVDAAQPDIAAPEKPLAPVPAKEAAAVMQRKSALEPVPHEIRQFCANTASAAADARVAWEAAKLIELEARLKQRIAQFEAKRAEFEDWLHKHDEAMKEAKDDVVAIYSRMSPESAASQLAIMNDEMAASLLTKLNSRTASAILSQMDPGRAARITNDMLGPINSFGGKKS
jgi:flagellar motility protein MotE (MotC chaperone)